MSVRLAGEKGLHLQRVARRGGFLLLIIGLDAGFDVQLVHAERGEDRVVHRVVQRKVHVNLQALGHRFQRQRAVLGT